MKSDKLRTNAFKIVLFFFLILICAFQYSCSASRRMTVAPKSRIPLIKDTTQEGTWETTYVVLEYEIVKQAGTIGLIIDGRAKRRLDQIVIWVLFLDTEGNILETKSVFNSGYRQGPSRKRRYIGSIEKTFEMPKQTNHLAFRSLLEPYCEIP